MLLFSLVLMLKFCFNTLGSDNSLIIANDTNELSSYKLFLDHLVFAEPWPAPTTGFYGDLYSELADSLGNCYETDKYNANEMDEVELAVINYAINCFSYFINNFDATSPSVKYENYTFQYEEPYRHLTKKEAEDFIAKIQKSEPSRVAFAGFTKALALAAYKEHANDHQYDKTLGSFFYSNFIQHLVKLADGVLDVSPAAGGAKMGDMPDQSTFLAIKVEDISDKDLVFNLTSITGTDFATPHSPMKPSGKSAKRSLTPKSPDSEVRSAMPYPDYTAISDEFIDEGVRSTDNESVEIVPDEIELAEDQ